MGRCLYCMQKIEDGIGQCPHCQAPIPFAPERPTDLRPGTVLQGRYVIGRSLGHGGYGITYLAYDTHLEGIHVIKEYFPKNGGRTPEQTITFSAERTSEVYRTRERFLKEAKMMTQAQGLPNVIRVTNQFEENGTSYILMDYLEGATLNDWMFADKPGRKFTWQEAVKITIAALDGLKGLHQRGILHRDISCSNIFLCNNGEVYIIDFGNAEWISDTTEHPETIQTFYKKPYTAPEQIQGRAQGPATDIYAMAVVLFKTIAGQADASLSGKALPPVASVNPNIRIPSKLDKIMEKATDQDPSNRFQSAEAMRKQLYDLVKPRHTGRNILLSLLAAAILGVGGYIGYRMWRQSTWAQPTVSFADETNVVQNEKSVGSSETVWIHGTGEPGETLSMTLSRNGENLLIDNNIQIDGDGNWNKQISTDDLTVGEDEELRFVIQLKYAENDLVMADQDLYLMVSNRYADLRLGYLADPGVASVGQEIQIGGSRQKGVDIVVTVTGDDGVALEETISGADDTAWTYTFNTETLPIRDELTLFTITATYPQTGRASVETLRLDVQPELKPLTMTYSGANPVRDSGAVIQLTGTASMNQTLTIQVREIGAETAVVSRNQKTDSEGNWNEQIRVAELGIRDGETRDYQIAVQYIDQPDIAMEGGPLYLQAAIPLVMSAPAISAVTGGEEAGTATIEDMTTELFFTGTAAREQTLWLYLDDEVFSSATADSQGSWTAGPFTAADLGGQEGTRVAKSVYAAYADAPTNRSGSVTVNLWISEILSTPEIFFDGTEADAAEYLSRETIRIHGTAKPGKRMTILIQDDTGKFTRTYTADADETGNWSIDDLNLSNLGVTVGEKAEFTLQVYYREDSNIKSNRTLRLVVSNPLFAAPVLTFADRTSGEKTIGGQEAVDLMVTGAQPGQELQLVINERNSQTRTADAEGKADFHIDAETMAQMSSLSIYARYTTQVSVTSDDLSITIDREATPIGGANIIEEEATSFTGYGEGGAVIRIYDQEVLLAETTVGEDESFTLTWEDGRILSSVRLEEVDAFGNMAQKMLEVRESSRLQINITRPINQETYGPNNREMEISGTATAGKIVAVSVNGETVAEVPAEGENGTWNIRVQMPEVTSSGTVTLSAAYADGRMDPVSIAMIPDFQTAEPSLRETLLSQDTTEIHATIERGAMARANGGEWVMDTENTGLVTIPVSGLNPETGLTVEVEDAWGNTSAKTFEVSTVSSRVEGLIQKPSPSTQSNLSGSETMELLAYVVAGEAATVSSRTMELYSAEVFTPDVADSESKGILRMGDKDTIEGNQLRMVAEAVGSNTEEIRQGWKLSRNFSPESYELETGDYVLALFATVNGQRRCLAEIEFQYEPAPDVKRGNGSTQEGDGWVIGIEPVEAHNATGLFNPASVWFSGYFFHDETRTDLSTATFEFYGDAECTEQLIPPVNVEVGLYSRSADGMNLPFEIANNSKTSKKGGIVSYDAGLILLGAYTVPKEERGTTEQTAYVIITSDEIDELELGPFEVHISTKESKKSIKTLRNQLAQ